MQRTSRRKACVRLDPFRGLGVAICLEVRSALRLYHLRKLAGEGRRRIASMALGRSLRAPYGELFGAAEARAA